MAKRTTRLVIAGCLSLVICQARGEAQVDVLGHLPGAVQLSSALAISPNGEYVAGVTVLSTGETLGWAWSRGEEMQPLAGPDENENTFPVAVANNGRTIGYSNTLPETQFFWLPGVGILDGGTGAILT